LVPIDFVDEGNGQYSLDLPPNGNIAPPGAYMLFAINADGTPSEAQVIRIGA
jgi:hypothetical protein